MCLYRAFRSTLVAKENNLSIALSQYTFSIEIMELYYSQIKSHRLWIISDSKQYSNNCSTSVIRNISSIICTYWLHFVRLGKCIFKANHPGNGVGQLDSKNACFVSSCTWKLLRGKACLGELLHLLLRSPSMI